MEQPEGSPIYDYAVIEDLDPSNRNGFHVIYDREVPFEMRTKSNDAPAQPGTLEAMKVKILVLGHDEAPQVVRLELSSESDLFFHYTHIVDEQEFRNIQDTQKLVIDFIDYPGILIRMLNSCIKEPHVNLAILTVFGDTDDARLDFIQNMQYKFVELMFCECRRSPDAVVQHHITYRYNAMKQKLAVVQSRLQDITGLVKLKNPSLLLQLQKANTNANSLPTPPSVPQGKYAR